MFTTQPKLLMGLGKKPFENIDGWLVVLEFNSTLTAKVISWQ